MPFCSIRDGLVAVRLDSQGQGCDLDHALMPLTHTGVSEAATAEMTIKNVEFMILLITYLDQCDRLALRSLATVAQDCSQPCACPTDPAPCLLGSSLVLDGCGCCKVCVRQLGEPCSLLEPCDHHKELYCDYALHSHTETGICMAQEGQTCDLRGVIYRSGESFQPSCKHHCVCINGEIGCVSLCVSKVRLPSPDCPYPHHIQIPGKCCEEWICHQTPQYQLFQSVIAGSSQIQSLPSSYPTLVLKNTSPLGLPEENPRDNCIIQTTEWSQCSASCGMGVSFRITNNKQHCQLERQTRICTVRPCNSHQEKEIKSDIMDVNQIFKDLAVMIHDQGEMIESCMSSCGSSPKQELSILLVMTTVVKPHML
ncbi:CCN family member 2-like [Archocentrus centrarchus]|uniref:CCN family member 2-like n=1 Tax=Archocentrus centrarchus TaxID=63155 RepID=UPI0011EA391A|nr:CCN family member 2-like [Archocentrus centrarchus]